jgi:hypothetical protein
MSQTTIDQTDADKDQAAFDADMEYMCDLVDRIGAHLAQDAISASAHREVDLIFWGLDFDHQWSTGDRAADLLADWRREAVAS